MSTSTHDKTDSIAMTLGVLGEITKAAQFLGYFVRDVVYRGAEGVYEVTYGSMRDGDVTVGYTADGTTVSYTDGTVTA